MRKSGIAYKSRGCAASRTMVSLAQPGGTERKVPGSPADLMWKHKGNNSMPRTQWSTEDVYDDALQDPHDTGKAGLLETQSPIGAACPPPLARLEAMLRCALVQPLDECNLSIVGGDR